MAKIVEPPKGKRVECSACHATIEYLPEEVERRHGTDISGGPDGWERVKCPPRGLPRPRIHQPMVTPLTAAQRARVIELLRCAAALESYEEGAQGNFLRSAAIKLSAPWEIENLARQACRYVCGDGTSRSIQLAAAAHVESQNWP